MSLSLDDEDEGGFCGFFFFFSFAFWQSCHQNH